MRRIGSLVCLVTEIACGAVALTGGPWWIVVLLAATAIVSFRAAAHLPG